MSVLEDLWNRKGLNPDSVPQLIRDLQRERNALQKEVQRLQQMLAETEIIVRPSDDHGADHTS